MAKKDIAILAASALLVLACGIWLYTFLGAPIYRHSELKPDYGSDPLQESLAAYEPIQMNFGQHEIILYPLADYSISAYLVSKRRYRGGFMNELSPWDYALLWGNVQHMLKDLKFDQIVRFCLYSYKSGATVDPSYVAEHMANTHLIPANANIRKAMARAKKGDSVRLEGYLVRVHATRDGKTEATWQSSLTRNDTGNGACEVMYVSSLQIGKKIYL